MKQFVCEVLYFVFYVIRDRKPDHDVDDDDDVFLVFHLIYISSLVHLVVQTFVEWKKPLNL